MDNVTMNACQKEDQLSIELKMLVEHVERSHLLQFCDEFERCREAAVGGTGRLSFDGSKKC